jgi:iron complex transport system substrate-binding protein
MEIITSLSPDLVIMSVEGNLRESFEAMQQLGVTIFVSNPRTFEGIYKSIRDLALLSGHPEEGTALVRSMKQSVGLLARTAGPGRSLFLIVSLRPLVVVGDGTFLSELLAIAGGTNLAAGTGMTYPTFSREEIVRREPEALIITSEGGLDTRELLQEFPEWTELPAVRDNRVFFINPDLVSRPGPRVIDGLNEIAQDLR